MKILFITRPIVPPWDEAGKNTVFELANLMKDQTIHLLTTKDFSCKQEHIILERVYTKGGYLSGISYGQKLRLFFRLLKRDDIDIYHFFFKPTFRVAMAAKFILNLKRKKSVQTVVTIPEEREKLSKSIFSSTVVAGSRFMQERLAAENIKSEFIPFGVNADKLSEPFDILEAKRTFGLENSLVVLFAGHLHPGRGINVVADSVEDVIKQFPNVKFVFACRFLKTKSESQNLKMIKSNIHKHNLSKNVHFLGKIDNIKKLIQAADIVVFPPNRMIFKMDYPLIILEAMALQKPVIFSNVAPMNELYENNCNIMIERNDHKQLSDLIISLFSDRGRMRLVGENARILVEKKFNIKTAARQYLCLYEKLMQSK
jgi:glycosyltransferase involved in cell wall biosynthesis